MKVNILKIAKSVVLGLVILGFCAAVSVSAQDNDNRKHIVTRSQLRELPFSDAVLVGDTLYISGKIGLDTKTGKPPATAEDETRLVMDSVKETVEAAGMSMDDVVRVQVFCSDLTLFDKFNAIYRTYFHGSFSARAFLGTNKLLFGARFEVMATAVRSAPTAHPRHPVAPKH